jgi:hypothetical protein
VARSYIVHMDSSPLYALDYLDFICIEIFIKMRTLSYGLISVGYYLAKPSKRESKFYKEEIIS